MLTLNQHWQWRTITQTVHVQGWETSHLTQWFPLNSNNFYLLISFGCTFVQFMQVFFAFGRQKTFFWVLFEVCGISKEASWNYTETSADTWQGIVCQFWLILTETCLMKGWYPFRHISWGAWRISGGWHTSGMSLGGLALVLTWLMVGGGCIHGKGGVNQRSRCSRNHWSFNPASRLFKGSEVIMFFAANRTWTVELYMGQIDASSQRNAEKKQWCETHATTTHLMWTLVSQRQKLVYVLNSVLEGITYHVLRIESWYILRAKCVLSDTMCLHVPLKSCQSQQRCAQGQGRMQMCTRWWGTEGSKVTFALRSKPRIRQVQQGSVKLTLRRYLICMK